MSPGSFYTGVSPSPSKLPPSDQASANKENQDPLSFLHEKTAREKEEEEEAEAENPSATATSKHFGGEGGAASGGGVRARVAPALSGGLRKRFRSPLSVIRSATNNNNSNGSASGGDNVSNKKSDSINSDPTDPSWRSEYACPRLDAAYALAGSSRDVKTITPGASGSGRLKRRRTLGLGCLAPKGLIRGLDGIAPSGAGASCRLGASEGPLGRRSQSLGGGEYMFLFFVFFLVDFCV